MPFLLMSSHFDSPPPNIFPTATQNAFTARASASRAEAPSAGDESEGDIALALEPMARLDPFHGFSMVVDDTNSDKYRGGCSQVTPREFVDVAPEREKLAGGDGWVARAVMRCAAACEVSCFDVPLHFKCLH